MFSQILYTKESKNYLFYKRLCAQLNKPLEAYDNALFSVQVLVNMNPAANYVLTFFVLMLVENLCVMPVIALSKVILLRDNLYCGN